MNKDKKKIYYVTELLNKKHPTLPVGLRLVESDKSDVYLLASGGEKLYEPINSDGYICINPFDLTTEDPHSREVRGPWEFSYNATVTVDKLPDGVLVNLRVLKTGIEFSIGVCIDIDNIEKYDREDITDSIEDMLEALRSDGNYIFNQEGILSITWDIK